MGEQEAVKVLSALSQATRIQIVRYLIGCGAQGAPAGEIAEAVDAVGSKSSFHLSNLENAGVITSQRQSRKIIYRVDPLKLGGAISFLLNDCCEGNADVLACCGIRTDTACCPGETDCA